MKKRPMTAVSLAALLATALIGAPGIAQAATRAQQQLNGINHALSQQLQVQQQNQGIQWQLSNQRMRQQIDAPFVGAGSAACPVGSGC